MEHKNQLIVEFTKHIVTISMATIGLLITGLNTFLKDSYETSAFIWALRFLTFAILSAVVSQAALVDEHPAFGFITEVHVLAIAWLCFLAGVFLTMYGLIG